MVPKPIRVLQNALTAHLDETHHQPPNLKPASKPVFQMSLPNYDDSVVGAKVEGLSRNTDQQLMVVTEDKAFICLNKNLRLIGKKRWIQPLSLLITLLLALATSEFDKLTWVSPYLLKATFIVSATITAGWLVWEIMTENKRQTIPVVIRNIFEELRG